MQLYEFSFTEYESDDLEETTTSSQFDSAVFMLIGNIIRFDSNVFTIAIDGKTVF